LEKTDKKSLQKQPTGGFKKLKHESCLKKKEGEHPKKKATNVRVRWVEAPFKTRSVQLAVPKILKKKREGGGAWYFGGTDVPLWSQGGTSLEYLDKRGLPKWCHNNR